MQSIHEHLLSRHLDPERYRVHIDEEDRVASFPLYNLSGQMVGYQAYRPEADKVQKNDVHGRYYTFLGKEGDGFLRAGKKKMGFWGTETLTRPGPVFLTEGIFDAVRIANLYRPVLALLSNDPKPHRNQLRLLNRTLIAICDDDDAGRKLAKMGNVSVKTNAHDLGDSSDEEVVKLVSFGLHLVGLQYEPV